ncbi:MAG TPA: TIR domain-containing protein [Hyalangium sp.]|nr:TIR domain-containing protein [Hyalangium sp.]
MSGLFLSYRRSDASAWAGRLFDHLAARFGSLQVFMDVEGGIPAGAHLGQTLENALATCDALLVLIGPTWLSCTGEDGRPRLEAPEDWVRTEVSTALQRRILVIPVLFGGAQPPRGDSLPEELRQLAMLQALKVTDEEWAESVDKLVTELLKLEPLRLLADVTAANTGLRLLRDLSSQVPEVAEAVNRSREAIANTHDQAGKLETFKLIHDELHVIEFECLRPMQASGPTSRLRPFKIRFDGVARRIQDALQTRAVAPLVQEALLDELEEVATAFQAAVALQNATARAQLLGALNVLLTRLPPQLEQGISAAAQELNLDRLVVLMDLVRQALPRAPLHHPELEPLMQSAEALHRLRNELVGRVDEHHRLQVLDSKLRTVCVGGVTPATVPAEWARIKKARSRLPSPPVTPELRGASEDLTAIEAELEEALGKSESQAALDLLQEYFRAVSSVFRNVDASLKEFCLQFSEVSQPLKTVLDMCRVPTDESGTARAVASRGP